MGRDSFFKALFEGGPGFIELRLIHPDTRRAESEFVESAAALEELIDSKDDGTRHVFFGPALRKQKRGRKQDAALGRALWADIDDDKTGSHAKSLAATRAVLLPPSFIVDSGHGYHAYWTLSEWTAPEELEELLAILKAMVVGDAVCDASRVMRVPGTMNVKGGKSVPCTLVRERADLVYAASDLRAVALVDDSERRQILSGSSLGYNSRSERDWAVVIALKRLGVSEAGVRRIFEEQPIGDKFRDDGVAYLNRTLAKAAERLGTEVEGSNGYFSEEDDCYFVADAKGSKRQVSTFVLDPKILYVAQNGKDIDSFVCDVRASGQVWEDIILPKSVFGRTGDLSKTLRSVYMQWLGSDKDVRHLLPYLVDRWERRDILRPR